MATFQPLPSDSGIVVLISSTGFPALPNAPPPRAFLPAGQTTMALDWLWAKTLVNSEVTIWYPAIPPAARVADVRSTGAAGAGLKVLATALPPRAMNAVRTAGRISFMPSRLPAGGPGVRGENPPTVVG